MFLEKEIHTLLEPTVLDLGYKIWGIEYIHSSRPTLRIYIDKEEGYISIDDCSIVSRAVSALLDVADPIDSIYDLEVSSPGINRRLFTPEQYKLYIGEKVNIHLRMPILSKRKWFGKIVEVSENSVTIDTNVERNSIKGKPTAKAKKVSFADDEETIVEILFSNILKSSLEPDF